LLSVHSVVWFGLLIRTLQPMRKIYYLEHIKQRSELCISTHLYSYKYNEYCKWGNILKYTIVQACICNLSSLIILFIMQQLIVPQDTFQMIDIIPKLIFINESTSA